MTTNRRGEDARPLERHYCPPLTGRTPKAGGLASRKCRVSEQDETYSPVSPQDSRAVPAEHAMPEHKLVAEQRAPYGVDIEAEV